jgi:hypothetical protein
LNWFEPTDEQRVQWAEFVKTRPDNVRKVIEAHGFAPWKLYRIEPNGNRVTINSFDEVADGSITMTVHVGGEFNVVSFSRSVFGISPDKLVECDLPGPNEPVGDFEMNPLEVKAIIEKIDSCGVPSVDFLLRSKKVNKP